MRDKKDRILDLGIILLFFVIPIILNWKALYNNEIMFNGDGMIGFSPKIFGYQSIASGEFPLWNSYVITGSPFLADPTSAFFYPFHVLALFFSPTLYTNLYYILHMGFAGLFAYFFLKQIGNNKLSAFAGSVVFSLTPIIGGFRREHIAVYTSIIWMPLILYFIEKFIQSDRKRYLLFSSLSMTLQLVGGSPQWVVYTAILASFYLFSRIHYLKRSILVSIKAILLWGSIFLLFSSAYLIPVAESIVQSSRGAADYFCLYSTNWRLFLMTIFPNVYGDIKWPLGKYASAEISIEVFMGTITFVYALYAIRYHFNNWLIRFSVGAMALSMVFSSSCNTLFVGDIIKSIPLLNLFGVQSRILFVYIFFGIVCFTYGISDISNGQNLKRLARYGLFIMLFIILLATLIYTLGWSASSETVDFSVEKLTSSPFGIPIILSVINFLAVGGLYLTRNQQEIYKFGSIFTILLLLFLTGNDLWRFSSLHSTANFDALTKTEETTTLKELLNSDDPYRIMVIYDSIYGGDYYKSGLVDNWSELNGIRNIKGFSEFENPRLNELLRQIESRDNGNGYILLSEGSILSMLSVKYILIPLDTTAPKAIPSIPESEALKISDPVAVPGDGNLFVSSTPIQLKDQGYYQVTFDMELSQKRDLQLFYVDFYGGPEYDLPQQDKYFEIKKGNNHYSGIIYAGEKVPHHGNVDFRIIGITHTPLVIDNLTITKLVDPPDNPDYELVSQTSRYNIYENKRARELLYIPQQVKSINNAEDLRRDPGDYPSMDQIGYVEDFKSFSTSGDLDILSVKNNSLSARTSSDMPTFVVHAQSFFPGWKAYVDGKSKQIYLVNGVIQGIEVPPGEHTIQFKYDPWSVKVGALISGLTLLFVMVYILIENKKRAGGTLSLFTKNQ